jgi:hypothetical protein
MTVGQLREEMSSAEFFEWWGFLAWEMAEAKKAERKARGRG